MVRWRRPFDRMLLDELDLRETRIPAVQHHVDPPTFSRFFAVGCWKGDGIWLKRTVNAGTVRPHHGMPRLLEPGGISLGHLARAEKTAI